MTDNLTRRRFLGVAGSAAATGAVAGAAGMWLADRLGRGR